MHDHLKKITARAKQIRRAHPSIKWTNAIKEASRELKSHKAPAKKSKPMAKKTKAAPHRSARPAAKKKGSAHLVTRLKDHYKDQLAKALLAKDLAKTKRDRKKKGKKVIEIRAKLRKIS